MHKFFITTPIYYVNDVPHLGSAYTTIAADVLARYYRLQKTKVYFLTGTDEHGAKISQAAEKANRSPQEFTDEMAAKFKEVWQKLNIDYDCFVRTTDPGHQKVVIDFLQNLKDAGYIYPGAYKGLYCTGCEAYKTPSDLVHGKCPDHGTVPETIAEDCWFFRLSDFSDALERTIESDELKIRPLERKNEVLGFLQSQKLQDVAISRAKVEWGIPLPWDKTQTVYVWIDALLNYFSASRGHWPPDLHLMSKDILRFHGVIWPAMLLAAAKELPKEIFVHGYFTVNGQKMSKTLGNVVDPMALAQAFGPDAVRYFLLREFSFGQDGDFSQERFQRRYTSDLANDLGNLVMRVLTLAQKVMLQKGAHDIRAAKETKISPEVGRLIVNLQFHEALTAIWKSITSANQTVDREKLWAKIKSEPQVASQTIKTLLSQINQISVDLSPFMPETSVKIQKQLEDGRPEVLFPKK